MVSEASSLLSSVKRFYPPKLSQSQMDMDKTVVTNPAITPSTQDTKYSTIDNQLKVANTLGCQDKKWRQNRVSLRLYDSCDCHKENQYHRIVSLHTDDQSSSSEVASSVVTANSRQSNHSQASKSTLNVSLKKVSEKIFDRKSVNSFA